MLRSYLPLALLSHDRSSTSSTIGFEGDWRADGAEQHSLATAHRHDVPEIEQATNVEC